PSNEKTLVTPQIDSCFQKLVYRAVKFSSRASGITRGQKSLSFLDMLISALNDGIGIRVGNARIGLNLCIQNKRGTKDECNAEDHSLDHASRTTPNRSRYKLAAQLATNA